MDKLSSLSQRLAGIEARLERLHVSTPSGEAERVAAKQLAVLARLQRLETHECSTKDRRDANGPGQNGSSSAAPFSSAIHERLHRELESLGFSTFRFVRAPAEYYDQPLEFRRDVLNAASTHHLCKTIIMENTRAHPSVDGWSDPNNSKYYIVIVQYTARLHAEKLKRFVHKLNGGSVGTQYFNMRLAPEDVSDELSGYEHNAVTPIGIAAKLPIVISHRICELDPPALFWIGAGEVDLKVGIIAREFVDKYRPFVADCTY